MTSFAVMWGIEPSCFFNADVVAGLCVLLVSDERWRKDASSFCVITKLYDWNISGWCGLFIAYKVKLISCDLLHMFKVGAMHPSVFKGASIKAYGKLCLTRHKMRVTKHGFVKVAVPEVCVLKFHAKKMAFEERTLSEMYPR